MEDAVKKLLESATKTNNAREAMAFSQAACNAANAIAALGEAKRRAAQPS